MWGHRPTAPAVWDKREHKTGVLCGVRVDSGDYWSTLQPCACVQFSRGARLARPRVHESVSVWHAYPIRNTAYCKLSPVDIDSNQIEILEKHLNASTASLVHFISKAYHIRYGVEGTISRIRCNTRSRGVSAPAGHGQSRVLRARGRTLHAQLAGRAARRRGGSCIKNWAQRRRSKSSGRASCRLSYKFHSSCCASCNSLSCTPSCT